MLGTTSKSEFLRVGLARYPDARETVDYFEVTVMEAIFAAFEAKAVWNRFQPIRDSAGSLLSGKATGTVDRFIHAFVAGTLPNRVGGKEKVWVSIDCANGEGAVRCRRAQRAAVHPRRLGLWRVRTGRGDDGRHLSRRANTPIHRRLR